MLAAGVEAVEMDLDAARDEARLRAADAHESARAVHTQTADLLEHHAVELAAEGREPEAERYRERAENHRERAEQEHHHAEQVRHRAD